MRSRSLSLSLVLTWLRFINLFIHTHNVCVCVCNIESCSIFSLSLSRSLLQTDFICKLFAVCMARHTHNFRYLFFCSICIINASSFLLFSFFIGLHCCLLVYVCDVQQNEITGKKFDVLFNVWFSIILWKQSHSFIRSVHK